jgi:hypothetical protein
VSVKCDKICILDINKYGRTNVAAKLELGVKEEASEANVSNKSLSLAPNLGVITILRMAERELS